MGRPDKEVERTSDTLRWLAAAAADWLIIAAAMTPLLWWPSWWLGIVAVLIIGNRQHALGILGHDGAHFAICSHRGLNDALTRGVAFYPLGADLAGYRRFHFDHHRYVRTSRDPELLHKRKLPQWETPLRWTRLIAQVLGDLVGGAVPHVLMAMRLTSPPSFRWQTLLGLLGWWTVALAGLWWVGGWWLVMVWWVSVWTSMWAFFRLRMWTEHVGTPTVHRFHASWWMRMVFTPHNTWLHWEHHERPGVSFARLPEERVRHSQPPILSQKALYHALTLTKSGPVERAEDSGDAEVFGKSGAPDRI